MGCQHPFGVRTKKPGRPTVRESTIGVYLLRAAELGIKITDLGNYHLGEITDMIIEKNNDYEEYPELAQESDIKKFFG